MFTKKTTRRDFIAGTSAFGIAAAVGCSSGNEQGSDPAGESGGSARGAGGGAPGTGGGSSGAGGSSSGGGAPGAGGGARGTGGSSSGAGGSTRGTGGSSVDGGKTTADSGAGGSSRADSGGGTGGKTNPEAGMDAGTKPSDAGTASLAARVVHVHDSTATNWDFGSTWYGDHVDAAVVQKIFDRALTELTGASTTAAAWTILLPDYADGKKFAIKVNFNNYTGKDPDMSIDAIIEPVNAVIQTLLDFGVPGGNICVYDVTNGMHKGMMPQKPFIDRCVNPDVKFFAYQGNSQPFSATEKATFPSSMGVSPLPIAQCLVAADYLINLPIMKSHYMQKDTGLSVTSLGLKHHFGSVDGNQVLHNTCTPASNPNAQVELYKNKHISGKTVLTVVDWLFGSWAGVSETPKAWKVLGGKAGNALVVAKDPVALDCVLTDFLAAEFGLQSGQGYTAFPSNTWDPLRLAETAGLGTFEKGDPTTTPAGSGYSKIQYVYVDGVA